MYDYYLVDSAKAKAAATATAAEGGGEGGGEGGTATGSGQVAGEACPVVMISAVMQPPSARPCCLPLPRLRPRRLVHPCAQRLPCPRCPSCW
jgi:hypothetical protein